MCVEKQPRIGSDEDEIETGWSPARPKLAERDEVKEIDEVLEWLQATKVGEESEVR